MTDNNKLITALASVGIFLAIILMVTVASNINLVTPLISECGVSTRC